MSVHQDYFDEITRCLMSFQYIEEALKQNLIRLHALIYFRIKKYVPYDLKPNIQSINNAAMGRLIELYKIFCDDNDLISDLRKIKDHRDKIAHQGLLMTVEEMNDKDNIKLKTSELEEIDELAKKTLNKMVEFWNYIETTLNHIADEQRTEQDG